MWIEGFLAKYVLLCVIFFSKFLMHVWAFRKKAVHFIQVQKRHFSHAFGGSSLGKGQVTTPRCDNLQRMGFFFAIFSNPKEPFGERMCPELYQNRSP